MIIALDIGNTNIVVGGIENSKLIFQGRIETDCGRTAVEYAESIIKILRENNCTEIDGGIISSVVPEITKKAESALKSLTKGEVLTVGQNIDVGINVLMDNPKKVGEDMLVDAIAALDRYKAPMLIFDMGTASTCSILDKNGNYIGSIIAPGVGISMNALTEKCAKLPKTSLEAPKGIIAKNTDQSIKCGVVYGNAAMLDGLADRVIEELGCEAEIIATGGISRDIVPYCRHKMHYDPDLTLRGLAILWDRRPRKDCIYEYGNSDALSKSQIME
ncbi:type III pantothenate kinase [Clostridiales bacterium]|nr:type III pantothenate kinase [Clostridiales bacterium]